MIATYILYSHLSRRTYIGSTVNLIKRMQEHRNGKVIATRHQRPLALYACRPATTITEARQIEKYWKNTTGRRFLKKLFVK